MRTHVREQLPATLTECWRERDCTWGGNSTALFYIWFASNVTIGDFALGFIPITMGLSISLSIASFLMGTLLGGALLGIMSVTGSRTGVAQMEQAKGAFGRLGGGSHVRPAVAQHAGMAHSEHHTGLLCHILRTRFPGLRGAPPCGRDCGRGPDIILGLQGNPPVRARHVLRTRGGPCSVHHPAHYHLSPHLRLPRLGQPGCGVRRHPCLVLLIHNVLGAVRLRLFQEHEGGEWALRSVPVVIPRVRGRIVLDGVRGYACGHSIQRRFGQPGAGPCKVLGPTLP
ncbi:cytosine permease [Thermogymnomonas acidicola]|uniref:cytosine permease n=1 Tax=Thermogymnomonas acidicola TaxID=399579 RepID=UPI00094687F7|nr:cytosine permease [Thermogymnomonas acidicola]